MPFTLDDLPERYRDQVREQLRQTEGRIPRGQPEARFQRQVLQVARALEWRAFHSRTVHQANGQHRTAVTHDGVGFPDLVLAKRGRILFVELKVRGGSLRPQQREWKTELEPSGLYRLWTPNDWPEIEAELRQEEV